MPSASSATPSMLRALNERTVLDTIRADAPISRAEISRRVGISKPTVSLVLRSLLEANLVRQVDGSARGRYGATLFEAVPEARLVLGLDIGARFLRGAICDLHGEVRARQDVEVAGADASTLLDAAVDLRDQLLSASELWPGAVDGAVIGVPGAIDPVSGAVRLAGNIPGLEGLALARELSARIGLRVSVENDINLAAVGEQWRGVGRGVESFAFLSVGTGLGAGLVVRGELVRGHHGTAGELDYALLGAGQGQDDPCAAAISSFAAETARGDGEGTRMAPPYSVPSIFGAARAGDRLAQAVVKEAARRITAHVLPIAAVADVELVVLGGGIGANGDLLLAPIRERLAALLPYPPRVEVSSLGDAAVLAGALATGLAAALENAFIDRG
ncbi:MAG TPA: ROK family transcriptional regulator [Solirubrobacteraceae bacterium]|nr:ROK family transcriptional regulator [Solirubrobacteraceae bacterium]